MSTKLNSEQQLVQFVSDRELSEEPRQILSNSEADEFGGALQCSPRYAFRTGDTIHLNHQALARAEAYITDPRMLSGDNLYLRLKLLTEHELRFCFGVNTDDQESVRLLHDYGNNEDLTILDRIQFKVVHSEHGRTRALQKEGSPSGHLKLRVHPTSSLYDKARRRFDKSRVGTERSQYWVMGQIPNSSGKNIDAFRWVSYDSEEILVSKNVQYMSYLEDVETGEVMSSQAEGSLTLDSVVLDTIAIITKADEPFVDHPFNTGIPNPKDYQAHISIIGKSWWRLPPEILQSILKKGEQLQADEEITREQHREVRRVVSARMKKVGIQTEGAISEESKVEAVNGAKRIVQRTITDLVNRVNYRPRHLVEHTDEFDVAIASRQHHLSAEQASQAVRYITFNLVFPDIEGVKESIRWVDSLSEETQYFQARRPLPIKDKFQRFDLLVANPSSECGLRVGTATRKTIKLLSEVYPHMVDPEGVKDYTHPAYFIINHPRDILIYGEPGFEYDVEELEPMLVEASVESVIRDVEEDSEKESTEVYGDEKLWVEPVLKGDEGLIERVLALYHDKASRESTVTAEMRSNAKFRQTYTNCMTLSIRLSPELQNIRKAQGKSDIRHSRIPLRRSPHKKYQSAASQRSLTKMFERLRPVPIMRDHGSSPIHYITNRVTQDLPRVQNQEVFIAEGVRTGAAIMALNPGSHCIIARGVNVTKREFFEIRNTYADTCTIKVSSDDQYINRCWAAFLRGDDLIPNAPKEVLDMTKRWRDTADNSDTPYVIPRYVVPSTIGDYWMGDPEGKLDWADAIESECQKVNTGTDPSDLRIYNLLINTMRRRIDAENLVVTDEIWNDLNNVVLDLISAIAGKSNIKELFDKVNDVLEDRIGQASKLPPIHEILSSPQSVSVDPYKAEVSDIVKRLVPQQHSGGKSPSPNGAYNGSKMKGIKLLNALTSIAMSEVGQGGHPAGPIRKSDIEKFLAKTANHWVDRHIQITKDSEESGYDKAYKDDEGNRSQHFRDEIDNGSQSKGKIPVSEFPYHLQLAWESGLAPTVPVMIPDYKSLSDSALHELGADIDGLKLAASEYGIDWNDPFVIEKLTSQYFDIEYSNLVGLHHVYVSQGYHSHPVAQLIQAMVHHAKDLNDDPSLAATSITKFDVAAGAGSGKTTSVRYIICALYLDVIRQISGNKLLGGDRDFPVTESTPEDGVEKVPLPVDLATGPSWLEGLMTSMSKSLESKFPALSRHCDAIVDGDRKRTSAKTFTRVIDETKEQWEGTALETEIKAIRSSSNRIEKVIKKGEDPFAMRIQVSGNITTLGNVLAGFNSMEVNPLAEFILEISKFKPTLPAVMKSVAKLVETGVLTTSESQRVKDWTRLMTDGFDAKIREHCQLMRDENNENPTSKIAGHFHARPLEVSGDPVTHLTAMKSIYRLIHLFKIEKGEKILEADMAKLEEWVVLYNYLHAHAIVYSDRAIDRLNEFYMHLHEGAGVPKSLLGIFHSQSEGGEGLSVSSEKAVEKPIAIVTHARLTKPAQVSFYRDPLGDHRRRLIIIDESPEPVSEITIDPKDWASVIQFFENLEITENLTTTGGKITNYPKFDFLATPMQERMVQADKVRGKVRAWINQGLLVQPTTEELDTMRSLYLTYRRSEVNLTDREDSELMSQLSRAEGLKAIWAELLEEPARIDQIAEIVRVVYVGIAASLNRVCTNEMSDSEDEENGFEFATKSLINKVIVALASEEGDFEFNMNDSRNIGLSRIHMDHLPAVLSYLTDVMKVHRDFSQFWRMQAFDTFFSIPEDDEGDLLIDQIRSYILNSVLFDLSRYNRRSKGGARVAKEWQKLELIVPLQVLYYDNVVITTDASAKVLKEGSAGMCLMEARREIMKVLKLIETAESTDALKTQQVELRRLLDQFRSSRLVDERFVTLLNLAITSKNKVDSIWFDTHTYHDMSLEMIPSYIPKSVIGAGSGTLGMRYPDHVLATGYVCLVFPGPPTPIVDYIEEDSIVSKGSSENSIEMPNGTIIEGLDSSMCEPVVLQNRISRLIARGGSSESEYFLSKYLRSAKEMVILQKFISQYTWRVKSTYPTPEKIEEAREVMRLLKESGSGDFLTESRWITNKYSVDILYDLNKVRIIPISRDLVMDVTKKSKLRVDPGYDGGNEEDPEPIWDRAYFEAVESGVIPTCEPEYKQLIDNIEIDEDEMNSFRVNSMQAQNYFAIAVSTPRFTSGFALVYAPVKTETKYIDVRKDEDENESWVDSHTNKVRDQFHLMCVELASRVYGRLLQAQTQLISNQVIRDLFSSPIDYCDRHGKHDSTKPSVLVVVNRSLNFSIINDGQVRYSESIFSEVENELREYDVLTEIHRVGKALGIDVPLPRMMHHWDTEYEAVVQGGSARKLKSLPSASDHQELVKSTGASDLTKEVLQSMMTIKPQSLIPGHLRGPIPGVSQDKMLKNINERRTEAGLDMPSIRQIVSYDNYPDSVRDSIIKTLEGIKSVLKGNPESLDDVPHRGLIKELIAGDGSNYELVVQHINTILEDPESRFVVTHYGSSLTRGTNSLSHCTHCFLIGNHYIPAETVARNQEYHGLSYNRLTEFASELLQIVNRCLVRRGNLDSGIGLYLRTIGIDHVPLGLALNHRAPFDPGVEYRKTRTVMLELSETWKDLHTQIQQSFGKGKAKKVKLTEIIKQVEACMILFMLDPRASEEMMERWIGHKSGSKSIDYINSNWIDPTSETIALVELANKYLARTYTTKIKLPAIQVNNKFEPIGKMRSVAFGSMYYHMNSTLREIHILNDAKSYKNDGRKSTELPFYSDRNYVDLLGIYLEEYFGKDLSKFLSLLTGLVH